MMHTRFSLMAAATLLLCAAPLAQGQQGANAPRRNAADDRLPAFTDELTSTHVDYVFVVDVSGSMVGLPSGSGNAVIFPRVRQRIAEMIRQLQPGSSAVLLPFAETVQPGQRFDIQTDADRQAAVTYLNSLTPDGRDTYVYRALSTAFQRYNQFRGTRTNRVAIFLVYTDGLDNGPERLTMQQIVREFSLVRQPDDWLYYATLGRPLAEPDRRALEESGFATYVANPRGEVSPLWIVEPQYRYLNFGNLLRNPRAQRIERFAVNGFGPFPAGAVLRVATEFETLSREQGVNVAVEPGRLLPVPRVDLRLVLENAEGIRPGEYEGTLRFIPTSRSVLVRPDRIRVRFAYEAPRTVRLVPPPGQQLSGLRLQALASPRDRERRDTARVPLRLEPNDEAQRKGGTVYGRVEADPANPSVLPDEALLLNGRPAGYDTIEVPAARALELAVTARAPQVKPGTYRGRLRLADGSAEVDGPREIPWQVTVRRPPIPLWVWAALLAAVAAVAAAIRAWMKPVLQGRLIVEAPAGDFREIVLRGPEVRLDEQARPAGADSAVLRIVPEGTGRDTRPRVYKIVGDASIRRAGETLDQRFHNEILHDGDELRWGEYRLSYHRS
jgi:hypothetical protein